MIVCSGEFGRGCCRSAARGLLTPVGRAIPMRAGASSSGHLHHASCVACSCYPPTGALPPFYLSSLSPARSRRFLRFSPLLLLDYSTLAALLLAIAMCN